MEAAQVRQPLALAAQQIPKLLWPRDATIHGPPHERHTSVPAASSDRAGRRRAHRRDAVDEVEITPLDRRAELPPHLMLEVIVGERRQGGRPGPAEPRQLPDHLSKAVDRVLDDARIDGGVLAPFTP